MLSWDNPDDIIIVNFSDMEKNSSRATQDIKWLFSQAEKNLSIELLWTAFLLRSIMLPLTVLE